MTEATASVHERLAAILAELPAIGKGQRNAQQGFMYRGHDDVMNALNPLLSKHQVFFVPHVLERVTAQRQTRQGGVMFEVNLHVQYTFFGPAGDSVVASAWGEGTDSGDKSTNKAMTMALKNVLAQTFAVSTEEIAALDTDRDTPEQTTGTVSGAGPLQGREGTPEGAAAVEAPSGEAAAPTTLDGPATEKQRSDIDELVAACAELAGKTTGHVEAAMVQSVGKQIRDWSRVDAATAIGKLKRWQGNLQEQPAQDPAAA